MESHSPAGKVIFMEPQVETQEILDRQEDPEDRGPTGQVRPIAGEVLQMVLPISGTISLRLCCW
jgi:hypothetical protein